MGILSKFPRHKTNPYVSALQTRTATIYQPDDYTLSVICSLSACALRVLMVLAARVSPETGTAKATNKELREILGGLPCNISRSKKELEKADLVSRCKTLNEFFVSPKVVRPLTMQF